MNESSKQNSDIHTGTVIDFDEHLGRGRIHVDGTDPQALSTISFHCVNIADGSRTIQLDERVSFRLCRHPIGGYEAVDVISLNKKDG